MSCETEDRLATVFEWAQTIWVSAMLIALLPVLVAAAALVLVMPFALAYVVWGLVFDIFRIATRTPELPQQVLQLIGLL